MVFRSHRRSDAGSAERTPAALRVRRKKGEEGSAYLIVLLVLVVLTILAMGLAVLTQTEVLAGSSEQIIQRVFYAADSGIALSTARVLVQADHGPQTYQVNDPESVLNLQQQVDVSTFLPILDSPCNLCEINNAGTYQDRAYRRINHAVTAIATRDPGGEGLAKGQKAVTAMVEFQPWRQGLEALAAIDDVDQLKQIKF
jgi:Tfp pilus assembly protein PilX